MNNKNITHPSFFEKLGSNTLLLGWEDHLRKNNENDYRYSVPEKGEIIVNNEIKLKQNENQSGTVRQTSHILGSNWAFFFIKKQTLDKSRQFSFQPFQF